jgi:bla regulator protein BlaR1
MTGWVVQTLAATTALMAALLIVRRPAARILGARAAYALWLLPALRMVMPAVSAPLAPLWRVAHSGSVLAEAAARQPGMVFIVARVQAIIAGTATQLVPIQGALLAAWLGGAVLWFAWQMLHYACFMTGALRHADAASGRIRGIRVLYTTGVSGPAAAGILRKFVFLPADFAARYTVAERSLALLHEAVHHRRHDLAANVVALIVFALHWWNPVAHRAYRAYRADQELACDATVLLRLSKAGRHTYGSAMLKSAANHVPGAACALNNKDEIRRRLLGLACEPVSPSRRSGSRPLHITNARHRSTVPRKRLRCAITVGPQCRVLKQQRTAAACRRFITGAFADRSAGTPSNSTISDLSAASGQPGAKLHAIEQAE